MWRPRLTGNPNASAGECSWFNAANLANSANKSSRRILARLLDASNLSFLDKTLASLYGIQTPATPGEYANPFAWGGTRWWACCHGDGPERYSACLFTGIPTARRSPLALTERGQHTHSRCSRHSHDLPKSVSSRLRRTKLFPVFLLA